MVAMYSVWFRKNRKEKWAYVGKAVSRREAVELIGGRGSGHWYIKEGLEKP